jgi:hypothetical protein
MAKLMKSGVSISVIDYSPVIIVNWMLHSKVPVDGTTWYRLMVSKDVSEWLKTQDPKLWHLHADNFWTQDKVDVQEELFAIIKLKFYNTPDWLVHVV